MDWCWSIIIFADGLDLALQVSHVLAKPIESLCGYMTVLPGAFSAFRWAAIEVSYRLPWLSLGMQGNLDLLARGQHRP